MAVLKRQQEILRERQAQLKEAMARLDHKVLALEAMADAVPGRITLEELPAVPWPCTRSIRREACWKQTWP